MVVMALGIFAFLLAGIGLILLIVGIVFFFAFKKRKVLGRILGSLFMIIGLACCIPAGLVVLVVTEGKKHEQDAQGPLLNAIEQNDSVEVGRLLESGQYNLNEIYYGSVTPLTFAIGKEKQSIVRLLIDRGADVNLKDDFGDTPLIKAISTADTEIISLLLVKGADVNETDYKGYTALDFALQYNYTEITDILKQYGAKTRRELP